MGYVMNIRSRIIIACLFGSSLAAQLFAASGEFKSVQIASGWQFRQLDANPHPGLQSWHTASVPGVVQTDLLENKLIPDPFYRDNEGKVQWVGLSDWEYRTSIQIESASLNRRHIELVFAGLDTFASVTLNGVEILKADNMFREWRVDVKPLLKAGGNELRVVLRSPIKELRDKIKAEPYPLYTEAATSEYAGSDPAYDPYIRKSAYMFGWDWGPRLVAIGIWRPVSLELWDDTRITDFNVRQEEVTTDVARMSVETEVQSSGVENAVVVIRHDNPGSKEPHGSDTVSSTSYVLHAGNNLLTMPLSISNPARWYPNGYGPHTLYNFVCEVLVAGKVVDRRHIRIGLRSVELRREHDQWGRSFEFVVNGISVFAKGASVIPFDSFPSRVTSQHYRRILESAQEAHMNMIRVWGGGHYQTEEFYSLCDELGLMVWQDFAFGGGIYPDDAHYLDNSRQEAIYQLRRLRHHASIVLWCGNNEVESVWFDPDNGFKKTAPVEVRECAWQNIVHLFNGILAVEVTRLGNGTPYWPSTPSSDFEAPADNSQFGDTHYWDVWGDGKPIAGYEKQFPRFMSEYGFQSFPEMKTVESFAQPEDFDIGSTVMQLHQKSSGGNQKMLTYLAEAYPRPKDFESFLYLSQVQQAEAIRIAAEHLRRNRPHVMGSIYWQLNDCWPGASWSSIDYYGRWKALQFYARRFYADLLLSPHKEDDAIAIHVVSDRVETVQANVRVRLMRFDGKVLLERKQDATLPALASSVPLRIPLSEIKSVSSSGEAFLATELIVDGKPVSTSNYFFQPAKELKLPHPTIHSELKQLGKQYVLQLQSPTLARSAHVSFGQLDASISDNYMDLLPGESIELMVNSDTSLDELRKNLKVLSLVDSFADSGAKSPQ